MIGHTWMTWSLAATLAFKSSTALSVIETLIDTSLAGAGSPTTTVQVGVWKRESPYWLRSKTTSELSPHGWTKIILKKNLIAPAE